MGLQGTAGTGKTSVLSRIREAAEFDGYDVRGLAPTTRAAANSALLESGPQRFSIILSVARIHRDVRRRYTFSMNPVWQAPGKLRIPWSTQGIRPRSCCRGRQAAPGH
jgi:hypothetical protein